MTKQFKIVGISSTILLLIFAGTNPDQLPSAMLIAPFALIFVTLLFGSLAILGGWAAPGKVRLRIALITAIVPVVLLVLQSLGQLTVRDLLALSILGIVAYFYISRFTAQPANR